MIKPTQTLVQPTGNCKELDSYLYICGWFSHIWGWLRVSCSQSWSISFIHLSVPCLYKCGQFFYTYEGDLYNCGWFLYIWGKFYTFVEIYTFEGPTGSSVGLNLSLNQGCILTFLTTLAKFTSCLMYVYHIYMVSAMSCSYSNNVSQTSMYNIEYKCSYWTFSCWLKIGMAILQELFW